MAKEPHLIIEIKNKKVFFEYHVLTSFTAGLVLTGTEIKAIREGKVNLTDSWCAFANDELWVNGLHISEYRFGSYYNHDVKRSRKLLLNRSELKKLQTKSKEKGFTIIPIRLFVDNRGYAKLEIGLARGKHHYDKRETLKQQDAKRDLDRQLHF